MELLRKRLLVHKEAIIKNESVLEVFIAFKVGDDYILFTGMKGISGL